MEDCIVTQSKLLIGTSSVARLANVLRSFYKSTLVVWSDTFPRLPHNSPFTRCKQLQNSSSSVLAYSFLQLAIISQSDASLRFYMVVPVSAGSLGRHIYGHQKGAPYFCSVKFFYSTTCFPREAVKLRVTSAEDFSSDSAVPKVSLLHT